MHLHQKKCTWLLSTSGIEPHFLEHPVLNLPTSQYSSDRPECLPDDFGLHTQACVWVCLYFSVWLVLQPIQCSVQDHLAVSNILIEEHCVTVCSMFFFPSLHLIIPFHLFSLDLSVCLCIPIFGRTNLSLHWDWGHFVWFFFLQRPIWGSRPLIAITLWKLLDLCLSIQTSNFSSTTLKRKTQK